MTSISVRCKCRLWPTFEFVRGHVDLCPWWFCQMWRGDESALICLNWVKVTSRRLTQHWPAVCDSAQRVPALHRRAPPQRGCSPAWPTDHGMSSAGSPCITEGPWHNGRRGSPSCATVSEAHIQGLLDVSSSHICDTLWGFLLCFWVETIC